MKLSQMPLRILGSLLAFGSAAAAQREIGIEQPTGGLSFITAPYRASSVPAIRLENSPRLAALIRAGNLYLSAHDVVALAIENNIDVEIQRYGPLLAQQILKRAQGAARCAAWAWEWPPVRKASA